MDDDPSASKNRLAIIVVIAPIIAILAIVVFVFLTS
jgi:hypothetical protein